MSDNTGAEQKRLQEERDREKNWKRWGPYLAERQWATVREDYSASGEVWSHFPHDHARSRAYRWGEDGLLGLTDRQCRLCFAPALWNGRDPILKERLFGLTGPEGNHGEDVKECYFYLDSTPTHSYMKALYKYPQATFPYTDLVEENGRRGKDQPEYELVDTGVFDEDRYFDVFVEYAKASANDILIRITAINRGPEPAVLHVLPTVWFRNTWTWGCRHEGCGEEPTIRSDSKTGVVCEHETLGRYRFSVEGADRFLFTDNETNGVRLWDASGDSSGKKDAFHACIVNGDEEAVRSDAGTKTAAHFKLDLAAGASHVLKMRLGSEEEGGETFEDFDAVFDRRIEEADAFYEDVIPTNEETGRVSRQAFAGLLWSKQFYHYIVRDWLEGDEDQPDPPESRKSGRNHDWRHLYNHDVISMPDKWEYPWYASWDLAFHTVAFADIDPDFAKDQLILLLREWYMHPSGQIPAYEFAFSDVNPPVHAWACWRVYKICAPRGERDTVFLERVFQKLLLNFTWWVNRKDREGNHLFSGGFLGLDNIGVFDRSQKLPEGGYLEQADGTAWMGFYCATLLSMALELAKENPGYQDVAFKFFRHFIDIADAINEFDGNGLWDDADGFYYDELHAGDRSFPMKVRSLVGLVPLIAAEVLPEEEMRKLPEFWKRVEWFLENRKDLAEQITYMETDEGDRLRLLAIPSRPRLERLLQYLFDESEFLAPHGIRSLSKYHADHPFEFKAEGETQRVSYAPGESNDYAFGGNSNWRGPVWFPINYLIIEALERYGRFYGDSLKVAYPTGSGNEATLAEIARGLERRHASLFVGSEGPRWPGDASWTEDPHWRNLILFHEYFHGDSGKGLGASHQTGWTALVARMLKDIED